MKRKNSGIVTGPGASCATGVRAAASSVRGVWRRSLIAIVASICSLLWVSAALAAGSPTSRPSDFAVYLAGSSGVRVISDSAFVTREMISGSDTTIMVRLGEAALDTLWDEFTSSRLVEVPTPSPELGMAPVGRVIKAAGWWQLTVRARGVTQRWEWNSWADSGTQTGSAWAALRSAVDEVQRMAREHRDTLRIPPQRSAYE